MYVCVRACVCACVHACVCNEGVGPVPSAPGRRPLVSLSPVVVCPS